MPELIKVKKQHLLLNYVKEVLSRYLIYYSICSTCSIQSVKTLLRWVLGVPDKRQFLQNPHAVKKATWGNTKLKAEGWNRVCMLRRRGKRCWNVKDCKQERLKRWSQGHQRAVFLAQCVPRVYAAQLCWWELLSLFKKKPCVYSSVHAKNKTKTKRHFFFLYFLPPPSKRNGYFYSG